MGPQRAKLMGIIIGLPWLNMWPGRMKDMSEDSLHGQIWKRGDSLVLGAKELSSKAEPRAGCHCPVKGLGKRHLLQTGTNGYFAAAGASVSPISSAWHRELCLGRHSWTHPAHHLGQGSVLLGRLVGLSREQPCSLGAGCSGKNHDSSEPCFSGASWNTLPKMHVWSNRVLLCPSLPQVIGETHF